MKVLLVNGSPHKNGCTFTALCEVEKTLKDSGIETEWFYIGSNPVRGCAGCGSCKRQNTPCIFNDDGANALLEAITKADGVVVGSPVYFAGPNSALCALMDRAFYAGAKGFAGKPAAAVVSCRRGGASAALDRLNKYFTYCRMPLATSQYWNMVHGTTPDEVRQDKEGLQTMRTLGQQMAYLLKGLEGKPQPAAEKPERTSFIR